MFFKQLQIGNVELENNLILAPMAGVTDLPFRVLCKEQGAGMVCTEMASSRAIFYNDEKTKQLVNTEGEKRPISFQIFGSDEESMAYSAKEFSKFADIIDINMGCPAPKVVKNGDGSKLLLNLEKAENIIKAVVKNATVPVTLKIRKGWDKEHIVATEIAKIAENNGISLITVHGRTRTEFFAGEVDYNIIRKVKEAVSIPVIGNGNIVDEKSALEMFERTGVDGIMIGRGSLGNPWIFRNIKHFLKTGEKLPMPTPEEKCNAMKRHIELAIKNKGELVAIHEIRKHISWYTKNLPNASEFRNKVNHTENSKELLNLIDEYFNDLIIN